MSKCTIEKMLLKNNLKSFNRLYIFEPHNILFLVCQKNKKNIDKTKKPINDKILYCVLLQMRYVISPSCFLHKC